MKKVIYISGMHCASCEMLLEREVKKIKGVKLAKALHKKHILDIESKNKIDMSKLNKVVKECGYKVVNKKDIKKENKKALKKNSAQDYLQIGFLAIIMLFLFYLFFKLEITRFFPDFSGEITFFVAFLIGLIASVSTCLALVGGIIMSFGSMYKSRDEAMPRLYDKKNIQPHLYFHVGRVGGFVVLGGVLGLIGSKLNYSLGFTGYLTILVAIIMIYLGLQILNIVPSITRLGFHLPKGIHNKIERLQKKDHPFMPGVIGALTFFLPCGFTQSMQLAAVASGSFFSGSILMGAFALGTLPVLLALGMGSSYISTSNQRFILARKAIGILIIFFAVYSLNSGLVLAGYNSLTDYVKPSSTATVAKLDKDSQDKNDKNKEGTKKKEKIQIVKMKVDYTFKPTQFKVKKGIPVRWEIEGINVTGCSNEVVIPKLNITSGKLKKGKNIVEFTPEKEGVLPFSCWMGMIGGKFIVTAGDDDGKAKKVKGADSGEVDDNKEVTSKPDEEGCEETSASEGSYCRLEL